MAPTCLDNNGIQTGRLDVERVLPLGGRIPNFLYGSLGLEPCEEVSLKGTGVEYCKNLTTMLIIQDHPQLSMRYKSAL